MSQNFNIVCYTQDKTLRQDYNRSNQHFIVFGTKVLCFEGWDWSPQDFETESLKATFVSYAMNIRPYRVYVIDQHKVVESINVTFHDTKLFRT